jgi:hypothetical protein
MAGFRPILLDAPSPKLTVVGKEVYLECKFFGSPKPAVMW